MYRSRFIVILSFIVASCGESSTRGKNNPYGTAVNADPADTTADVKELIVYNRAHYTLLENLPGYLAKYIPEGYVPLDTVSADLNADGITDFFLAAYKAGEDSVRSSPRSLKILLGKPGGTYQLACESWDALAPLEMGGFSDPYPGIIAEKGKFVIQFAGGSNWKSTAATTFEYSAADKDWIQTKEITESYFMDKRYYKSDTATASQFGRISFKKNYCQ